MSAVIGPSVAVEDVAEMLGQPPAVVLPSINKALAVGILVADGATLTFRDSMTWRAITEAIPEPISRALHRQFGQLLLDRGNELQAAGHLVRGARQDDRRALQEMDRVVGKLLPSAPQAATDLAMRAVELTLPEDPARADRLVMVVRALTAEQRPQEAMTLIDESLAMPLPPLPRAELRCARAAIRAASGQPEEARAEAEELLAETDLPASIRDEATVVLLHALGELPDFAAAEQRAAKIISEPDMSSDMVLAAARALQATVRWNQGRLAAGLDLFRHAVSEAPAEEEQGPRLALGPRPGRAADRRRQVRGGVRPHPRAAARQRGRQSRTGLVGSPAAPGADTSRGGQDRRRRGRGRSRPPGGPPARRLAARHPRAVHARHHRAAPRRPGVGQPAARLGVRPADTTPDRDGPASAARSSPRRWRRHGTGPRPR